MVFSSCLFLFAYLPVVLAVLKLAPSGARNFCLLAVSLVFYGWSEPAYVPLMLLSTVVDYINGRQIERCGENRRRARRYVLFSVIFNLSLLGFFKYADFFLSILAALGIPVRPLNLRLPVGISFYTFQTMSYPIDVYRRQAPAQHSLIRFGAYVTLFPQLIAGPIVRYRDLSDQLEHPDLSQEQFAAGIVRFCFGLAKKVLLANQAGQIWETIRTLANPPVLTAWLGLISFAFQIYFDFSGYSDMAIGLGKMLGFDFPENFRYPYISRSITEFWRRWHISLSSWFRDVVYIPLGGSRQGKKKQIRNLLIVWLLTGLWHGASWNYVLWGLYFGVVLVAEKFLLPPLWSRWPRWLQHGYALLLILIGWVWFAFEDLGAGWAFLRAMLGGSGYLLDAGTLFFLRNNGILLVIMAVGSTPLPHRLFQRRTAWFPMLCAGSLILCTAFLVNATYNPFLYFRF